jgi:hypothetical protein
VLIVHVVIEPVFVSLLVDDDALAHEATLHGGHI